MPTMLPSDKYNKSVAPFLRWAGGKRYLINHIIHLLPADIMERRYFEPFLGAGSLFFRIQPKIALLGDTNQHLIECYKYVRETPDNVFKHLKKLVDNNSESFYYRVREKYNTSDFSIKQAARFIYLNRACFNGIFRVNKKGYFNVPYGKKEPPPFPSKQQLISVSLSLQNAKLYATSYHNFLSHISEKDFLYMDPPYPPLNGTSYFTHYTKERFNQKDQVKLAEWVKQAHRQGCLFMMSNADIPLIRDLYSEFSFVYKPVTRIISCKSKRHRVGELIITNYEAGNDVKSVK